MTRMIFALIFALGTCLAQEVAQPPLPTVELRLENGRKITAEVADETIERAMGLMFRESLAPDSGMLFVMPRAERTSFWMKNTRIPLSIAFLNKAGIILEIHDLEPFNEKPVASTFPGIAYALEMEKGWFEKVGVMPGERVTGLPRPTGQ
jgi:uncharacterized protein